MMVRGLSFVLSIKKVDSLFLGVVDNFSTLCVVQADLSLLSGSAAPKQGKNGKTYWTIVFSVEIHFGLTEFKARMKWKDKVCCFSSLFLTWTIFTDDCFCD